MAWTLCKKNLGVRNTLVGPNGTGKTLFALQLRAQCELQGLQPRYLSAEDLAGLEREQYVQFASSQLTGGFFIPLYETYKNIGKQFGLLGDAFILLNDKLDLKTRVEATLSQLFDRELTLSTVTGSLEPKMRKKKGDTYGPPERVSRP